VSEPWYQWQGDDLLLWVRAQPRASRDALVGPYGDALKVQITAPPVEGKANEHLIRFLAKAFGVPRMQVELLSGESGRNKRFRISSPATLPASANIRPASQEC